MNVLDVLRNSLAFLLDPLGQFRKQTEPLNHINEDAVKVFQNTVLALITGPDAFVGAAADAFVSIASDYVNSEGRLVNGSGGPESTSSGQGGTLLAAAAVCEKTEAEMIQALEVAAPPLAAESADAVAAAASDTAAAIEGGLNPVADAAGTWFTLKLGLTVGGIVVALLLALFGAYEWWKGQMESIGDQPLPGLPPNPTPQRLIIATPPRIFLTPEQEQQVDDIMRALARAGITGISREDIEKLIGSGFDPGSILAAILGWKGAGKSDNEIALLLFLTASNLMDTIPFGFSSPQQYQDFQAALLAGLNEADYGCIGAGIGGNAVTGVKYTTGTPFDEGRTSDYDVVIADPQLLQKAMDLGIPLRGGRTRTGPLSDRALRALGLYDLAQRLSQLAGRPVHFMIYNSLVNSASRAPTIIFFNNTCS
ncbi:MAG: hypothetical protein H0W02_06740 [Ktedonobacteraceae bacterium]|nr:hypothetical protein [Ktedonobacteraceae bacterium]